MIVHQAFYGEDKGTHTLLAASVAHEVEDASEAPSSRAVIDALFNRLVAYTDLPFRASSDTKWEPYLSGFAFEDYYIFSKTFPDTNATRSGMVFTHLLAAPLDQVSRLGDLALLLNRFSLFPDKNRRMLFPFRIALDAKDNIPQTQQTQGFASLVTALLSTSDDKPVIWLGQEGFSETLVALWMNLWPEIRKNLRFCLLFEPQDIEGGAWTIVETPRDYESRWRSFNTVNSNTLLIDSHVVKTQSEALLLGLAEAESIRKLLHDLEEWPSRLVDLNKVERCHEFLLRVEPTTDNVRALVRLLGLLSPNKHKGVVIKSKSLKSLIARSVKGDAEDITALKNIDLTPFIQGEPLLSEAVQQWVSHNIITDEKEAAKKNALLLVKALETPERWWSKAIQESLSVVLRFPQEWDKKVALSVWAWWQAQTNLVEMLASFIPTQIEVGRELVSHCPAELDTVTGDAIKIWARSRNWPVLHAATLASLVQSSSISPTAASVQGAFQEQLSFDLAPESLDGLNILFHRFGERASLDAALQIGENRLLQIAGEVCAVQPELMANLDVRNGAWRQIWILSVRKHQRLWNGVPDPDQVAQNLLAIFAEGTSVDEEILRLLAKEPQSDLTLHPARGRLWARLESVNKVIARSFLDSTAEGWLRRFRATVSKRPVEKEYDADPKQLETAFAKVLTDEDRLRRHLIKQDADQCAFGIELMNVLASIPQSLALSWVDDLINSGKRISSLHSKQFGSLVARRGWSDVANRMAKCLWRQHGDDWLPALHECKSLLAFMDRFMLKARPYTAEWSVSGNSHPNTYSSKLMNTVEISVDENEWWHALQTLCIELYPTGPEDRKLWSRAKGDLSKLDFRGVGSEQWQAALLTLRNGGGGKDITVPALVKRIQEDFPHNRELSVLAQTLPRAYR